MLFYSLEPNRAHEYFIPIRSKHDVISNVFRMIKRSNWSQYTKSKPCSGDYFE